MADNNVEIPEGAWPFIDVIIIVLLIATLVWIASSIFIYLRRKASNLTPVSAAKKNKKAQPDFLRVDKEARKEAIEEAEKFDKELDKREAEEERAARQAALKNLSVTERMSGLASLILAVFTYAAMAITALTKLNFVGKMVSEYSAWDRFLALIQNHPIGFGLATLIIIYHIVRFVMDGKWRLLPAKA